jgi:hypothetical protein
LDDVFMFMTKIINKSSFKYLINKHTKFKHGKSHIKVITLAQIKSVRKKWMIKSTKFTFPLNKLSPHTTSFTKTTFKWYIILLITLFMIPLCGAYCSLMKNKLEPIKETNFRFFILTNWSKVNYAAHMAKPTSCFKTWSES